MDSILLAWLQSTDEAEREHLLAELLLVRATPLIKHTLWLRLGFRLGKDGENSNNPDAEDIYHDVIAKLVQRLNTLRMEPGRNEIRNYRQFVTRMAVNACHDYLRAKSPARARLKNSLHDLLDRHRDFRLWRGKADLLLCGFAGWGTGDEILPQAQRLDQLAEHPEVFRAERFAGEDLQRVPRTKLVAEIFKWVGAPIELEVLVDLVAALLEVKDRPHEALDEEGSDVRLRLVDPTIRSDALLEGRDELRQFWGEVRRLSPRLREVVCLSFVDENGEDLVSLLLDAGVLTLPEMAADLGMPLEQLKALWGRTPMDSETLAAHLGATRRQICRWRHKAWQQLALGLGDGKTEN
jgi:RNA polymerase sigma factor (sigma-70 family)